MKQVRWSPEGKSFLTILEGFVAELRDGRTGARLARFDEIESALWVAGGRMVALIRVDSHYPMRLYRVSDGAVLNLMTVRNGGNAAGLVYTDQGEFDGEAAALSLVRIRVGDDMRTAALLDSGPIWDAHRRRGLLTSLFADTSPRPSPASSSSTAASSAPVTSGRP